MSFSLKKEQIQLITTGCVNTIKKVGLSKNKRNKGVEFNHKSNN